MYSLKLDRDTVSHLQDSDALRSIPCMVANALRWPAEVGAKFGVLLEQGDAQQLELESAQWHNVIIADWRLATAKYFIGWQLRRLPFRAVPDTSRYRQNIAVVPSSYILCLSKI